MEKSTLEEKNTQAQAVPGKPASTILAYGGVWFAIIAWGGSFVAARILLHADTTN